MAQPHNTDDTGSDIMDTRSDSGATMSDVPSGLLDRLKLFFGRVDVEFDELKRYCAKYETEIVRQV
jgi:hypothetical protein